jgi:hypothetical protein
VAKALQILQKRVAKSPSVILREQSQNLYLCKQCKSAIYYRASCAVNFIMFIQQIAILAAQISTIAVAY